MLAWQKARELVKNVYKAFQSCRDNGFKDQIQRASVSVLSNIAEGFESGTKLEFLNYLYIAKASAGEVRAQLYVASDVGYINISKFRLQVPIPTLSAKYLKGLAEECSRLIASFIAKLKQGGLSGSQYKKLPPKDMVAEIIRNAGYESVDGRIVKKTPPNDNI